MPVFTVNFIVNKSQENNFYFIINPLNTELNPIFQ